MSVTPDYVDSIIKLLSTLELEECLSLVSDLIMSSAGSDAVGIFIWDSDLESYQDPRCFGERKKRLKPVLEELFDLHDRFDGDEPLDDIDLSELSAKNQEVFEVLRIQRLDDQSGRCAVIVVGDPQDEQGFTDVFNNSPIATAIHNAWQFSEMQRENERLRDGYDQLEKQTAVLEVQTHNLIQDLTVRDSLRTKQVERERLVFWISHTVRSSVRIQEVLSTTVERICTEMKLSRCNLIHAQNLDKYEVYEYHANGINGCQDKFMLDAGRAFARAALSKKTPQSLLERDSIAATGFDPAFLDELGIKSGMTMPLIMRDRVLGVLFLQDCEKARDWNIDDFSLMGSLADCLAVAIENAELHMEVERQAVTDGLTGVANRRSFNESLLKEFERAKRYAQPLSLAVVDLDNLKKINDTYGHMTGDEAIKSIGGVLAQHSRVTDLTARYGGEEFCVLLPNTEIEMAEQLAERLRRLIRETSIDGPGQLSASIGVASYPLHADTPDTLFLRADEALYRAKQEGRNRVKVSSLGPDGLALQPVQQKPKTKQSLVQEKS